MSGSSHNVYVLGAGMAGLGAAYQLRSVGLSARVVDRKPYPGGHAASFLRPLDRKATQGELVFDEGPHVSFTGDERVRRLLAEGVEGQFEEFPTRVNNYWQGYWIKHPAQCNLHGLPTDLVVEILRDFVASSQQSNAGSGHEQPAPANYAQWLTQSYGDSFARTFPMQYGRKYHTAEAQNMSTDWLGPRLYRPQLEEVLRGALSPQTEDVHYVSRFRYPSRGGFVAFLQRLVAQSDLRLGQEVVAIDPQQRTLRFADGRHETYSALISSLPLPELIARLSEVPPEVGEAAQQLACTQCVLVNLAVDREDVSDHHWTYFYDEDIVFTRLSAPHLLTPHNAPDGVGTLQAEIYYSAKYRPREQSPEAHIEPTIRDLKRCGLLQDEDRILFREASLIPYANIIFDLDRAAAVATVLAYLEELGIHSAGRYGRWGYHWTDESFLSGEEAARKAIEGLD